MVARCRGGKMLVEIKPEENNCHFPYCINHFEGVCHSREDRELCLDMALKVLCIDETEEKTE